MARCLRCRAGNEWIESGKAQNERIALENAALRAENSRLSADLRKLGEYAWHRATCHYNGEEREPCTCGLAALLATDAGEEKK